jgi:hypothetical protein
VATVASHMTTTTANDGEGFQELAEDPDTRPSSTTAPPARPCDSEDLRTSVATNRREYAPDEWIVATTTIRNVGHRTCQVRQYADYSGDDGCDPDIYVHLSFDPGTGTYGDTSWTFGPYPACPPPALTLEPGESEERVNRFRFGEGRSEPMADGEWQVMSSWGNITDGQGSPSTFIRCKPGTCKPLSEYRTTTTTGRFSDR